MVQKEWSVSLKTRWNTRSSVELPAALFLVGDKSARGCNTASRPMDVAVTGMTALTADERSPHH